MQATFVAACAPASGLQFRSKESTKSHQSGGAIRGAEMDYKPRPSIAQTRNRAGLNHLAIPRLFCPQKDDVVRCPVVKQREQSAKQINHFREG